MLPVHSGEPMNALVNLAARITRISPRVIRFLISGGMAVATELIILYFFTDVVGLWYEYSFIIAFFGAFCVSFTLQKFWTFEDTKTEGVRKQASLYFGVAIGNLVLNGIALYILVEYMHLWYLFAQVLISAVIAIGSFLIYRAFIFNSPRPPEVHA